MIVFNLATVRRALGKPIGQVRVEILSVNPAAREFRISVAFHSAPTEENPNWPPEQKVLSMAGIMTLDENALKLALARAFDLT